MKNNYELQVCLLLLKEHETTYQVLIDLLTVPKEQFNLTEFESTLHKLTQILNQDLPDLIFDYVNK